MSFDGVKYSTNKYAMSIPKVRIFMAGFTSPAVRFIQSRKIWLAQRPSGGYNMIRHQIGGMYYAKCNEYYE